jgi:hypothetical protein
MRPPAAAFPLLLALLGGARPAPAQEAFPGQNDLAAGLACHANLDLECARARLERALAVFSPEGDSDYLAHVTAARQALAFLAVANDDLQAAEQHFLTLLLVHPSYALPPGEHPPKVVYVFGQAQESLARQRKATRPPVPKTDPPPKPREEPKKTQPPPQITRPAPPPPQSRWAFAAEGRWNFLFGSDADVVEGGPGTELQARYRLNDWVRVQAGLAYAYHPLVRGEPALQSLSLVVGAQWYLPLWRVEGRLTWNLGVQAMGTAGRYDHWLGLIQLGLGLAWPADGPVAAVLSAYPSFLMMEHFSSVFLPIGLALEVRWPS